MSSGGIMIDAEGPVEGDSSEADDMAETVAPVCPCAASDNTLCPACGGFPLSKGAGDCMPPSISSTSSSCGLNHAGKGAARGVGRDSDRPGGTDRIVGSCMPVLQLYKGMGVSESCVLDKCNVWETIRTPSLD